MIAPAIQGGNTRHGKKLYCEIHKDKLFDLIETVDSLELAREIDKRYAQIGKIMTVLVEIDSDREEQKSGVFPEKANLFWRCH